jgi:hypothetical protein
VDDARDAAGLEATLERMRLANEAQRLAELQQAAEGQSVLRMPSGGPTFDFRLWKIGNYLAIVRPKSGLFHRAIVLGSGMQLSIHYDNKDGSVPCVPGCKYCPCPARDKLYLPAAYREETPGLPVPEIVSPGILEVTGRAVLDQQWERGVHCLAVAEKKGGKSVWTYRQLGIVLTDKLPKAFVLIPYLERVFHVKLNFLETEAERLRKAGGA